MAIWIIEAKIGKDFHWIPILGFPGIQGVYHNRKVAREAAKKMKLENTYNQTARVTIVRYRPTKYIREAK